MGRITKEDLWQVEKVIVVEHLVEGIKGIRNQLVEVEVEELKTRRIYGKEMVSE